MAVEERANANPTTMADFISNSKSQEASVVKRKPDKITCNPPNKNTSFCILFKWLTENSNPMVNIRNTIPNSAK